MNKKGFVLAEAIVVAVFVLGMFTYLAMNIFPLITKYDQAINYDNPNEVYMANVLYDEILQTGKIDDLEEGMYSFSFDEESNNIDVDYTSPDGTKTEDISSLNSKNFQTDYYKNLIHNELGIKNILVLKADTSDKDGNTVQSILNTKNGLTRGMRNYYNYLKGRKEFSTKRFSILVEFESGKYASVSLTDYIYCFLTDESDTDDTKLKVTGWESACGPVPTDLEIPNELYLNNDDDGSKFSDPKREVVAIDNYAFQNKNIKSLILPKSLQTIGSCAFQNNQISKISYENEEGNVEESLPPNLVKIGGSAFMNNKITGELKLNDNLEIESYAFYIGNEPNDIEQKLTLVVPETVTSIGNSTFVGNNFEKLTIEKCDSNICRGSNNGNDVFGNSIKELTINSGELYTKAFYKTGLKTVYLNKGVDLYDEYSTQAFYENEITDLTIEECTNKMCSRTNSGGNKNFDKLIGKLTINGGTIGNYAFYKNIKHEFGVSELILGSEVSGVIGKYAFENNHIKKLDLSETQVGRVSQSAFSGNDISGELKLPTTLRYVEDYAFYNNQINELNSLQNVWQIGRFAFGHNKIENLDLSNVTQLGNGVFSNNPIKTLILSESLTTIPASAFNNGDFIYDKNNTINEFTLPASVTSIGDKAFWGNTFNSLVIEKCTLDICKYEDGPGVFSGGNKSFGSSIKNLKINSGQVGIMAFYVVGLEDLTLGTGVNSIGEFAFSNPMLMKLTIERSETDFLKNVTLGNNWLNRSLNPEITCEGVPCDLY